jgi:hypothetical protein
MVQAAMRKQADAEKIANKWLEHNLAKSITPEERSSAQSWAAINVQIDNSTLNEVFSKMYASGYAFGIEDARTELSSSYQMDWDSWKAGNPAAALLVDPPKGLETLLNQANVTIKGIDEKTLNDIGSSLALSLSDGLGARETAKALDRILDNPARSMVIARTETARALVQSNLSAYRDAGVTEIEWLVGDPEDEDCLMNDGEIVTIGDAFASGDTEPPVHPNCVCDVAPVISNEPVDTTDENVDNNDENTDVTEVSPEGEDNVIHDGVVDESPITTREQEIARTEFIPDKWISLTSEETINYEASRFLNNPRYANLTTSELKQMVVESAPMKRFIENGEIRKNGDIVVKVHDLNVAGLTKEMIDKLQIAVQDLQTKYPKDHLTVHVGGMAHKNAYGEAHLGDHDIRLNPTETIVKGQEPNLVEAGKWKMPTLAEVDRYQYTLAHEWGHTIDLANPWRASRGREIGVLKRKYKDEFTSGYSQKNTMEFFAEMFAEWHLSKGSTPNLLVQAMAEKYGWK